MFEFCPGLKKLSACTEHVEVLPEAGSLVYTGSGKLSLTAQGIKKSSSFWQKDSISFSKMH